MYQENKQQGCQPRNLVTDRRTTHQRHALPQQALFLGHIHLHQPPSAITQRWKGLVDRFPSSIKECLEALSFLFKLDAPSRGQ